MTGLPNAFVMVNFLTFVWCTNLKIYYVAKQRNSVQFTQNFPNNLAHNVNVYIIYSIQIGTYHKIPSKNEFFWFFSCVKKWWQMPQKHNDLLWLNEMSIGTAASPTTTRTKTEVKIIQMDCIFLLRDDILSLCSEKFRFRSKTSTRKRSSSLKTPVI